MNKMVSLTENELLLILFYLKWPDMIRATTVPRRDLERQLTSALNHALAADTGCYQLYLTSEQAEAILMAAHFAFSGGTWLGYLRFSRHVRDLETAIYRKMRALV
jgi:hypothetical protein